MKEEFTTLKANYDNLEIAYDLAINETHDATNNVAKLDLATSYDDLLVESTSKCVGCKDKNMVEAESYDDTIKIKEENFKLKKELQESAKHSTIVIETLDQDKKLAYENKLLKEEN